MKKYLVVLFGILLLNPLFSQVKIDGADITVDLPSSTFDKNIIRFNYFRASVNGNPVVSYERLITNHVSIELGGGVTYRSFLDGIQLELFQMDYPSFSQVRHKIGYSVMAGVRFYIKDDYMEGWYLNPFYRVVNYNMKGLEYFEPSVYKVRFNDLSLAAGYNYFLGNVHLDYYMGLGMRHAYINQERGGSPVGFPTSITQNKVVPILLIGARIGVSF